jgi:adenylate kinase family enzyme
MQRVLVIGASGTGKSTFAQELGEQTGLPVIHIDQLFWQPNWVQAPREVFIAGLQQGLASPKWVIEGLSTSTLDLRIPRADTIMAATPAPDLLLADHAPRAHKLRKGQAGHGGRLPRKI